MVPTKPGLPTSTVTVTPAGPVFTGETVNLKCVINSYYSDWRYEWYKDRGSEILQTSDRYTVNRDTVTIRGATEYDQGQYWCKGQRDGRPNSSTSRSAVSLSVKDLPTSTVTVTPAGPVFTGETVNLKCVINSDHSDWRYEWYKDSVILQTSGRYTVNRDTVTIRGATEYDQGQYWCKGQRDGRPNSSTSRSAVSLSVKGLPTSTVTVTPAGPVFTGETVKLKCVINSYYSNWRYEWYKDSVKLQTYDRYTVNRDTVTIRGATESDQGQYWCKGQRYGRPNSSTSSSVVSLSVKGKPVVKVRPDQRVFIGERVTLTCDIQGGGNIQWRYSWIKDGNTVNPYTTTTTTAYYSFTASASLSGEYRCRGERSDSHTDFSDGVTLTVSDLPTSTVTVTPAGPVFTGETVNLQCVINSDHSNWRYEWYKDSVKLQTSDDRFTVNRDTLTIRGAIGSDQGQYWCKGRRDGRPNSSTSSSVVSLSVKGKPVVKVRPDQRVFRGERVTLTCDIQGGGNIQWTYRWIRDGNTGNPNITTTTAYYSFTADVSLSGKYSCRGERSDSYTESDALTLTVSGLPTSTVTVTPAGPVFTGETVNLKCVIKPYHSNWRYEWYKDSVILQKSDRYTVNRDTVTIRGATGSDQGQYWCKGQIDGEPDSSTSSSAVSLSVKDLQPKPELTSDPAGAALTGNTVTLTCHMNLTRDWDIYWYKHTLNPETEKTQTHSYSLKIDSVSDGGQYWCRAGRGKPVYYTQYSDALWVNVTVSPKAVVTVRPDERVFRGETVTLRCDIKWAGDTEWTYRWDLNATNNWDRNSASRCTEQHCCTGADKQTHRNAVSRCSTHELIISSVDLFHSGNYSCRGETSDSQRSRISDAVTLTVSAEAQASLRVSPQPWLTEGESVTLICEVSGSSTGWTFSWFRDHDHLSDSSRGAGGSYTLSPAALQHTGVYTCRAERGRPAYYTHNSSSHTLWLTGVSASVSLVIDPSRSQHFSSQSLSLSCVDQSNSAGWTVRRYTDTHTQTCAKQTGSRCVIDSLSTSDSGVYWCESESGEKRRPRNITVHDGEVILASSVDPVIEGETLTLHCLHRSTNSSISSADFYKDGSLIQNQTTGEMSITTVSKSHEGFYSCKTERGQSLHSWISVTEAFNGQISVLKILSFLLAASPYLLATVVLLFKCYRARGKTSVTHSHTHTPVKI
ncbi:basement membrane-specific heparan sulfate proteoglycan core protein-like [Pimephales promelas]|uniref:basement membrane-specific heparan sulfate proteoglycan core protein-like n=1 Tax=Pimephales promelas TaxID=90988 RepID=UPI00195569D0|nr:basement membrane-specific heparan sulfate proteoglycan core protein-like [Pimephales promelas]